MSYLDEPCLHLLEIYSNSVKNPWKNHCDLLVFIKIDLNRYFISKLS